MIQPRQAVVATVILCASAAWVCQTQADGLGSYHDYPDLTVSLMDYASAYPAITQLSSLGQSVQGRSLWALKITGNPGVEEDEPEFRFLSTMHGDEPVGTEMCLYFIDDVLSRYGVDPRITHLVNETEIWVVPLVNPDGRQVGTRSNANGVDLNRDFPDGAGSPIGNIFDGPPMDTAGRQAETVNVMEWSAANQPTLSANFLTGALVTSYPYDNDGLGSVDSPTPDDALFEYLAETYSIHNTPMWNSPIFPHGITNGAARYSITGGLKDWCYRYLGDMHLTVELSDSLWPPESVLPGLWADNKEAMLALVEAAHIGVRGVLSDAATGLPVRGMVSVAGNTQPVFSDADAGDYHRLLLPGTYDLTFQATGYYPVTIDDVLVTDGLAIRLDVPLDPIPEPATLALLAVGGLLLIRRRAAVAYATRR